MIWEPSIKVLLHGKELWALESTLELGHGPLMRRQYDHLTYEISYAHLYSDGRIRRRGIEIGERADLVVCSPARGEAL